MDRCALFVDAGYLLADGAMAVHGTSSKESASWDYAGLLQFLAGLSTGSSGLGLLRCYWYEAAVDGRRTAEHDTLADLPGLRLRLSRMRPGKREGVETEIHRDLTTLARNGAISDALILSAEEGLAQAIADVQDLGIRVTLMHIAVDGSLTVPRSLRQMCDDLVEIAGTQLKPYLIRVVGPEAGRRVDQHPAGAYAGRPYTNGHALRAGGGQHGAPVSLAAAEPGNPGLYPAPVSGEYQPAAVSTGPAGPQRRGPDPDEGPERTASPQDSSTARTRSPYRAARTAQYEDQVTGAGPGAAGGAAAAPAGPASRPVPQPAGLQSPGRLNGVAELPGSQLHPGGAEQAAGGHGPGPIPPQGARGPQGPQGSYGPQPERAPAGGLAAAASLENIVPAAHAEGFEFGESVAREAPALWLEAVLARKPRMPSDLEARLLQGSALPIDSLLHDEVRLALRTGFWDSLERSRR